MRESAPHWCMTVPTMIIVTGKAGDSTSFEIGRPAAEILNADQGIASFTAGFANSVTARHIALAEPPMADLSVQTLSRSSELAWPPLSGPGKGLTLARPRGDAGR